VIKLFFTSVLTLAACVSNAQSIKVPVGKTFTVTMVNTNITNMSMMGQDVEMNTSGSTMQECAVKSITDSGYSLLLTQKKISGSVSVMGQENKFDSDDSSSQNTPGMSEAFKLINKTQEIKVVNGKTTTSDGINGIFAKVGMSPDNMMDVTKFFLTIPVAKIKQGYSWSDSTISETVKIVNQYIITGIADQQISINVSTDTKINMTMKQGEMDVKTNMKGFSTATRVYDMNNGLLVNEKVSLEMTGTAEIMGMSAPMTTKGTLTTTIK
jgi:hypothetical protein